MKVFLSVDLEGVTGTVDPQEMRAGREGYEAARRWMTSDANAAIGGAYDGGATEVLVCDSHGSARNLLLDDLDKRARLVRGLHKPRRMVQGLDASFGAALLVGYHARAGSGPGALNHTWVGKELHELRINGEPAGEIALVATVAGHFGVPVALVTGDDVACQEAEALLGDLRTVAVKRAVDRFSVDSEHPRVTADRIRAAAADAVATADRLRPVDAPEPIELEIEWSSTSIAQLCALVPGVQIAETPRTTRWEAANILEALDVLVVTTTLAVAVGDQAPYS
jgi:D-amino peptidase